MNRQPRSSLGVKPIAHRTVSLPRSDTAPLVAISQGRVVDFQGDAIVCAARADLLGGGGADMATRSAGGPELTRACRALPVLNQFGHRCDVGDAKLTMGGRLTAKWCIHAVGPKYSLASQSENVKQVLDNADRLLTSAYAASMARACEANAATVAVSLLPFGLHSGGCRLCDLMLIAVRAVEANVYKELDEVHIVVSSGQEAAVRGPQGVRSGIAMESR